MDPNYDQSSKYLSKAWIERILKNGYPEAEIRVEEISSFHVDNSQSILVTLTSESSSTFLGHFGLDVEFLKDGKELQRKMVLKAKPHGSEISKMLMGLATVCGEPLATVYSDHMHETGFDNTHGREITIYSEYESRLFPEIYGTYINEDQGQYFILMEYLDRARLLNTVMQAEQWGQTEIKNVLQSMAKWHAKHLGSTPKAEQHWKDTADPDYMLNKKDLWKALLENAHSQFPEIYTGAIYQTLDNAIGHLESYQNELKQFPKTLVHNDANLRNACIRSVGFCLYDWELADFHLPQYDLVEWLCFVLDKERYADRSGYLEYFRKQLNRYSDGRFSDKESFRRGFQLAALDFGLHRLGMYMMAHTVSPYPFLPRVVASYGDTIRGLIL